ncbi:MAG TPA: ArsB/NhaD family transporter [Solirubrobacterales bacterium]|nr:ArsB/NhaD family transporter [Solirubrobacterales bacterium]
MALAVTVFIAVLVLIASERVHYTKVVLVGAAVVVLGGVITQDEAIEAIDFNAIGLLAGMMVLVHITQQSGVYDYVAIRAGQIARGNPFWLVMSLAGVTALLSAFLPNLTMILLIVPITFLLADTLDIDPVPVILIEVVVSNLGGTATLIGDPPNAIIGGAANLSFDDFILNVAPIAAISFVVIAGSLYLVFRRRLQVPEANRRYVMELDAAASIEDPDEMRRTLPVLAATVVAFFLSGPLDLEPATVALSGATAALLLTRQQLEEALSRIEWATLFFLLGLFVMVGALEQTGAIADVADAIEDLTGGDRAAHLLGMLWFTGFASGLIDNIPVTAAMVPVIPDLQSSAGAQGDDAYWWALALGAGFGGNATIVASAANIAAAGLASRAGQPIGFLAFLRVGLPVTAVTLGLATVYVTIRYILL